MTIRIRLLRTHWRHWGKYSGITRYVNYLDGSRYRFVDHAVPHVDDGIRMPPRVQHWLRSLVQGRRMPWYQLSDLLAEIHTALRIAFGGIDVLHYLDPEHGMQYLPLWSRWIPWRPRILATFHQPLAILRQVVRRDVIQRLDHAVVVAPEQLPIFDGTLPPDRVSVLLHGIDTDFYHPPPFRTDSGCWTCLTVGHNLRDFEALREVVVRLRRKSEIHFQIVAPNGHGLDDLESVSTHHGLSDEKLRAMYQAADVLLLPLTNATANNALLEALACGLPVITTDLPAIRTYAPGIEAVRVPGNDPDAMVDAILALRDSSERREAMRRAARRRAEELSWSKLTPAYDRLYRQIAST